MANIINTIKGMPGLAKFAEDSYCRIPYLFGNGKALNPLSVVLLVSYKCNLRCKMCFYYNEAEKEHTSRLIKDRAGEELTLERIYKLIDDSAGMGVKIFTIHGGEPLLYPHIFEIAGYARSKGLLVNFVSNGALLNEEIAKKIVDTGINHICFSLDGPEPVHDTVRNVKGTFGKLMSGIKILKEMEKKGYTIPSLSFGTYISAINQHGLAELIDIVADTGIKDWVVGLTTYNGEKLADITRKILGTADTGHQGSLENIEGELKDINTAALKEQKRLLVEKNRKYNLNIAFPTEKAIENYSDWRFNDRSYCLYPWARTVISPYGEVFPCVNLSMAGCVVGNVREASLKDIWNSAAYVDFRRKLRKHKLFPLCSKCCVISDLKRI